MSTTYDGAGLAGRGEPPPVLAPGHTPGTVTDRLSEVVLTAATETPKWWLGGFVASFGLLMLFLFGVTNLFLTGIGIWGNNIPVGWGWDIVCFVWWIGIGHAGTLISAILLLLRQTWRNSINRFAEAMTLFAVACAGMYPILHLGRPWVFYWLLPYPNTMGMWPNFKSPLIWDVFAVSTYATISAVFWFVGLIPDLATLRDSARHPAARFVYGLLAMGWRGSARHWSNYESAYLLLAGLSTPLVLSVHSVVSFDFAVGIIPGWHTTVFPPYFVAGAVFSGFAMVLTLVLPLRVLFKLQDFITERHVDNMAKVMLTTGLIVAYGYAIEAFAAWYSGNEFELFMVKNRATGPYAFEYWMLILCNIAIPQLLWWKRVRRPTLLLWGISIVINVGMWLERYVIIVLSLHRDFLPSSWAMYRGTVWDLSVFAGTIGLFLSLLFLFIRFLPAINIFEVRTLTPEAKVSHGEGR
ncbi:hydrogenase [Acidobacteria bacterium ACD]|nr:MAG: hydrogenase [Acidobacteriota bacterium]MCE7959163.1 hydrogenase [Acidobacteria bacterium ACB2]MDL1950337.1 hydrogenase [Acidobacteria bacterium ACD]